MKAAPQFFGKGSLENSLEDGGGCRQDVGKRGRIVGVWDHSTVPPTRRPQPPWFDSNVFVWKLLLTARRLSPQSLRAGPGHDVGMKRNQGTETVVVACWL